MQIYKEHENKTINIECKKKNYHKENDNDNSLYQEFINVRKSGPFISNHNQSKQI